MILTVLTQVARHGRLCLVLGLVAGLVLPGLAAAMRPYLPQMVAFLLFLTAFRVGPADTVENLGAFGRTIGTVLVLQMGVPLVLLAIVLGLGLAITPLVVALVLVMSAPSVTGAPNFTILAGHDPAPALRLLIVGTALLPLTVVPVFWVLPQLGDAGAVLGAASRLLIVIGAATLSAFALRHWRFRDLSMKARTALDGATAIALAVVVVALMSAIGPALAEAPVTLLGWLVAAFAINFGAQAVSYRTHCALGNPGLGVPVSIVAGNRNIALFLVALPAATTDPLLIFIGCYQVPMYLTPLLLRRFYRPPPAGA